MYRVVYDEEVKRCMVKRNMWIKFVINMRCLYLIFMGKFKLEPYLEWERKVELVFYYYNITKKEKVESTRSSLTSSAI